MKSIDFVGPLIVMIVAVVPARSADPGGATRIVPWDVSALLEIPKVHPTRECAVPGMRSFFYEGAAYKGRPTRVFAYYTTPEGKPPAGGWPAAVCAHGWRRPEIYAFADSVVQGGKPLPAAARPELDEKTRRVWTRTTGGIHRAALCYTMQGGKWQRRYWENAACEFGENEVSSRLPEGATVFYFNVKDEHGNLVSSEFVEVKPR